MFPSYRVIVATIKGMYETESSAAQNPTSSSPPGNHKASGCSSFPLSRALIAHFKATRCPVKPSTYTFRIVANTNSASGHLPSSSAAFSSVPFRCFSLTEAHEDSNVSTSPSGTNVSGQHPSYRELFDAGSPPLRPHWINSLQSSCTRYSSMPVQTGAALVALSRWYPEASIHTPARRASTR